MKKSILPLLIVMQFCSCTINNRSNDEPNEGALLAINVNVVIVDEALNDRLNPDSPSYFGEEYVRGIKVLYLCDGKKLEFLDYYYFIGGGVRFFIENVKNRNPISEPHFDSFGHYFIDCVGTPFMENGEQVVYTYLSYPDGNEDEIKVRYFHDGGFLAIDKIWINGELALEGVEIVNPGQMYYNPKYFPWMRPIIDNSGKQTGIVREGRGLIVLTK